MPSLPAYISSHKADAARATFLLVRLAYPVAQCLTDCDIPIVYNGETYAPAAGLVVSGIQDSQEDRRAVAANITVGNGSDYWGTLLAALAGAQRHPTVQIFEAWLDPANPTRTPQAVRGLLVGSVESTAWNPLQAEFQVGAQIDSRSATLPWRGISTRCTYRRFKGPQCKYAGATATCDRSYATCSALGNQANFGGMRSLPEANPAEVSVTGYNEGYTGYVNKIFSIEKEE